MSPEEKITVVRGHRSGLGIDDNLACVGWVHWWAVYLELFKYPLGLNFPRLRNPGLELFTAAK